MGTLSPLHWLLVFAVVLLLFGGKGKISGIMGDFGKGLKSFKKSMAEDPDTSMEEAATDKANGSIAGPGHLSGANVNTGATSASARRV